MPIYIGCAGWSIPKRLADLLPGQGSHLERYAAQFSAVEIDSSFYRPHQTKTYARWAAATPDAFRFAVKIPKQITHERRLEDAEPILDRFLSEVAGLGNKLGALLLQLPPSLKFRESTSVSFLQKFRLGTDAKIVCEPRHASWFSADVDSVLRDLQISRVAADPAFIPIAALPGGDSTFAYYRLHGSPRMYYSAYTDDQLQDVARQLAENHTQRRTAWCIFDNTAEGAAYENAFSLRAQH